MDENPQENTPDPDGEHTPPPEEKKENAENVPPGISITENDSEEPGKENSATDAPKQKKKKKKKHWTREWGEALFLAFIAVLLARLFFFEAFSIPSGSMDNSLLEGDYVVVNKLAYGPRMPNTPLSVPFMHQKLWGNVKAYLDWISIPYLRIPGYDDIGRNDVIVFNFPAEDVFPVEGPPEKRPVDKRTYFIKRCVALPGDTFELRNTDVYVNGDKLGVPEKALFRYAVISDSAINDSLLLRKLGMAQESKKKDYWLYDVSLSHSTADSIRKLKNIRSVELVTTAAGEFEEAVFPYSEKFAWNRHQYGPFVIPKEGMTVPLTVDSLPLYRRIIVEYEHNTLQVRGDSIYINGQLTKTYTFEMNYYFMMGDNREVSFDSRAWGLVPEDHIEGRASMILYSYDKKSDATRWSRVFESIR